MEPYKRAENGRSLSHQIKMASRCNSLCVIFSLFFKEQEGLESSWAVEWGWGAPFGSDNSRVQQSCLTDGGGVSNFLHAISIAGGLILAAFEVIDRRGTELKQIINILIRNEE